MFIFYDQKVSSVVMKNIPCYVDVTCLFDMSISLLDYMDEE